MPTTHDYYEDPRNEDIQIYINGDFFHRAKATISVLDSGFLLGDGVWEGIRLNEGSYAPQRTFGETVCWGKSAFAIHQYEL